MIAELGAFALTLALAFAIAQLGFSAAARARRSTVLAAAGEGAALASFASVALAFAALIHAFVTSDFSVMNVAANSHTDKPLLYKVAGTWGSHEGSMLLWCLALTGYGAAAATIGRGLPRSLKALMVATQGGLGVVFLAYTVFASNPLSRVLHPPVEGRSLNPLLQDPALAIHPPFLYAGYVGMSVVFSLAVAALIEGRVDAAWARWVRPWALGAWSLLTVGITLGSFWAYYELGWGGWWFWDPVENASFMPWLAGTALLHSALVMEKREALKIWTVLLAIMTFSLS
ncbi:MAG TPA: cytochrome c biogenesis protein CcsA, partial [Phenylobacterium sp.]|nr:cytochrome c biogenesis protein CcsA [Phenylobacterium sp.]